MNNQINVRFAVKHYHKDLLETINFFREIAIQIDDNPESMNDYHDHEVVIKLCHDRDSTCFQRTKLIEAYSYGDAGALLACPGPSLSGLMIRELGNEVQNEYFFESIEKNKSTTFLAVTEPKKGSDAGQMETYVEKNKENTYLLNGEKWLVGHGADAPIGVLIARVSKGPLGIVAVLLSPDLLSKKEVSRHFLETVGLRGARLSRLLFNHLPIEKKDILGLHLSPMKRGMMAVMKTFNRMRPGVAAFALGQAQAVMDYVLTHRKSLKVSERINVEHLNTEISVTRTILYDMCKKIDRNSTENAYASIAKIKATKISEKCISYAIDLFGKSVCFEHPLLMKWYRDAFGYEYMEGTSYIQLKNIYQAYLKNTMRDYYHV